MIPDIATCPLLGREEGGGTPPVENHMSLKIQQAPKEVREETNPRDTVRTKPSGRWTTQSVKLAGRRRHGWRAAGLRLGMPGETKVSAGGAEKFPMVAKPQRKNEKDVNNTLSLFTLPK